MTIDISDVARREQYTGSAGVGPYQFDFEVLVNTDLAIYKNATLLTLTTDYTVTINGDGTGSVTLVSAATGTDTITIIGDRAIARTTDFVTGGDLLANSLNDELDALTIFDQQLLEMAGRALSAPVTDADGGVMTIPSATARANKYLAFDANGNPVAQAGTSESGGIGTMAYQDSTNVAIAGGSISGISDLAVADGGTGASTAANARINLGLSINSDVQAYDADTAKLDVEQTWTAQQTPMSGTLTDGATIDWNGDTNGQVVKVTLAGNRSMSAPTNITENNLYVLRVIQDGTGSRTLGFNAAYKFAGGTLPTLTTTASAVDVFTFLGGSGNVLYCTGKTLDCK